MEVKSDSLGDWRYSIRENRSGKGRFSVFDPQRVNWNIARLAGIDTIYPAMLTGIEHMTTL